MCVCARLIGGMTNIIDLQDENCAIACFKVSNSIQSNSFIEAHWLFPLLFASFFPLSISSKFQILKNDLRSIPLIELLSTAIFALFAFRTLHLNTSSHRNVKFTGSAYLKSLTAVDVPHVSLCKQIHYSVRIKCCSWKIVLESMNRNSLSCMLVLNFRNKQQIKPYITTFDSFDGALC